ncbi:MAG: helicase, partial [Alcaligenaceae bacterium]
MKLIPNSGADRVIDLVSPHLKPGSKLGCVTPSFSLFAYAELRDALAKLEGVQLILPPGDDTLEFLGSEGDRANRNRLQTRWLVNQCANWLSGKVDLRRAHGRVPQGTAVLRDAQGAAEQVVLGSFAFSTDGLGLTPGNPLNLIQASESPTEAAQLAQWFDHQWNGLRAQPESRDALVAALRDMGQHRAPFTLYAVILNYLFGNRGDEMDEERIVKSATGIRNTVVWKKLFKFQR